MKEERTEGRKEKNVRVCIAGGGQREAGEVWKEGRKVRNEGRK
jgi:hypothetical protein